MIKVEFISPHGARTHIASFRDEDAYILCLEILEEIASQTNSTVEETFLDDASFAPSWDGVHKILHQGYVYAKYADLTCRQTK